MSSNSISEIIGGTDSGGGIPQADDESRAGLAGGSGAASSADSLWNPNLELNNFIFGIVACSKVGFITVMWFIYYLAGTKITSYYYATWFSSLVVIYVAWGPVVVSFILLLTDSDFAVKWFFWAARFSIIGPLVGYFVPIVILILAYNERGDTGLVYSSKVHFWLGWTLAICITVLSILFELAYLPAIAIWYDISKNGEMKTIDDESAAEDLEDGPLTFDNDPEEVDEDDAITTFMSRFNITF